MKTTPRFSIGERVQASIDNSPLKGLGKIRDIACGVESWVYMVEPEEPGDWLGPMVEKELALVDTPATRARARQETIVHHAEEARNWAEAADEAEIRGEFKGHSDGQRYAAIAQAHGLASVSSVLAESAVGIEQ